MQNFKNNLLQKISALFLAIIMIVSSMPLDVFAQELNPTEEANQVDSVIKVDEQTDDMENPPEEENNEDIIEEDQEKIDTVTEEQDIDELQFGEEIVNEPLKAYGDDPYGYGWVPEDFTFSRTSSGSTDNYYGVYVSGFSSQGLDKLRYNKNVNMPAYNYSRKEVKGIANASFNDSDIAKLYVPNNIKTIDSYAFAGCKNLTSVIANGVVELTEENSTNNKVSATFAYCSKLTNVEMNSLEKISVSTAFELTGLKSVSFPNLKTITGDHAFTNCYYLTNANLPSLESISGLATFRDSGLKSVYFPKLTSISGQGTFGGNYDLLNAEFPALKSITESNTFSNCKSLTTVKMPLIETMNGNYTFSDCYKLSYLETPNLKNIHDRVDNNFYNLYSRSERKVKWIISDNFDERTQSIYPMLANLGASGDTTELFEIYTKNHTNPNQIRVKTDRYILNPIRLTFNYLNKNSEKIATSKTELIGGYDTYKPKSYPTIEGYVTPEVKNIDLTKVPKEYEVVDHTENIYYENETPVIIKAQIRAKKILLDKDGNNISYIPIYTFNLKQNGSTVATAQNDSYGNITFDMEYSVDDLNKTFYYSIVEVKGTDIETEYDNHSENVTVKISKNYSGEIKPSITYGSVGGAKFTNKKIEPKTNVTIKAKKIFKDENENNITDIPQFTFSLKDTNGGNIIKTVNNDKSGNVVFDLEYGLDDLNNTYKYAIEEVRGNDKSIEYDEHKEYVYVTIYKDNMGALSTKLKYSNTSSNPSFVNKKVNRTSSLQVVRLKNGTNPFELEEIKGNDDSVELYKVPENEKSKTLDGAVYDLYKVNDDGTEEKITRLTTKNGITELSSDLTVGKYKLKEVTPPKGYFASKDDLIFDITEEDAGKVLVKFVVNNDEHEAGLELVELPSTGGIGTTSFTKAGTGLIVLMGTVVFLAKKKKRITNLPLK